MARPKPTLRPLGIWRPLKIVESIPFKKGETRINNGAHPAWIKREGKLRRVCREKVAKQQFKNPRSLMPVPPVLRRFSIRPPTSNSFCLITEVFQEQYIINWLAVLQEFGVICPDGVVSDEENKQLRGYFDPDKSDDSAKIHYAKTAVLCIPLL